MQPAAFGTRLPAPREVLPLANRSPRRPRAISAIRGNIGILPPNNGESNGKQNGKLIGNWDFRVVNRH